jgi:hypothetical protein
MQYAEIQSAGCPGAAQNNIPIENGSVQLNFIHYFPCA